MRIYNSINTFKIEMEKSFEQIITNFNKYMLVNDNYRKGTIGLNSILDERIKARTLKEDINTKEDENRDNENSSDEEQNLRMSAIEKYKDESGEVMKIKSSKFLNNYDINENKINNNINNNINSQYKFLSYNKNDFKDELM